MSGVYLRLRCDSPQCAATLDLPVDHPDCPGVQTHVAAKVGQLGALGWGVVHVNGDNGSREEALLCPAHVYLVRQFLPLPSLCRIAADIDARAVVAGAADRAVWKAIGGAAAAAALGALAWLESTLQ